MSLSTSGERGRVETVGTERSGLIQVRTLGLGSPRVVWMELSGLGGQLQRLLSSRPASGSPTNRTTGPRWPC